MDNEIHLFSAEIIDYNRFLINYKCVVKYKLKILTKDGKKLYCWKTCDDFINLYNNLIDKGYKNSDIKYIPKNYKYDDFIEKISNITIKKKYKLLNKFLNNAVSNINLQWGIKINDDISVYKRRVRDF